MKKCFGQSEGESQDVDEKKVGGSGICDCPTFLSRWLGCLVDGDVTLYPNSKIVRVLKSSRLTEDDQNFWHFVRAVLDQ